MAEFISHWESQSMLEMIKSECSFFLLQQIVIACFTISPSNSSFNLCDKPSIYYYSYFMMNLRLWKLNQHAQASQLAKTRTSIFAFVFVLFFFLRLPTPCFITCLWTKQYKKLWTFFSLQEIKLLATREIQYGHSEETHKDYLLYRKRIGTKHDGYTGHKFWDPQSHLKPRVSLKLPLPTMKIAILCKLASFQPAEIGQKQLVCSQPERKTAARVHSVTFPTLNEALTSKSLTL